MKFNHCSAHFRVNSLDVFIHSDRMDMGEAAAISAGHILRKTIASKGSARIIVASAPSQDEVIAGLAADSAIDWSRVTVFHMDEYCGLTGEHAASFRNYQRRHLLEKIVPAAFHGILGEAGDSEVECRRYERILSEEPVDLVCMGIGENGHIAFNDPPVADFNDSRLVRMVKLDEACRQQQVNDGCFPHLASVPTHALTLTCPALMSGKAIVCTVPGARKAGAVKATLEDPISTLCPASVLRLHSNAVLHLDRDSAELLSIVP